MACSLWPSNPLRTPRSGSEAKAASLSTTMWSSAACSDWSIQSRLPDMWQALRVTRTRWLTDRRRAVALRWWEKRQKMLITLSLMLVGSLIVVVGHVFCCSLEEDWDLTARQVILSISCTVVIIALLFDSHCYASMVM